MPTGFPVVARASAAYAGGKVTARVLEFSHDKAGAGLNDPASDVVTESLDPHRPWRPVPIAWAAYDPGSRNVTVRTATPVPAGPLTVTGPRARRRLVPHRR